MNRQQGHPNPGTKCPKCGNPLFADREPDYGYCLDHGTIYLGIPFPAESVKTTLAGDFWRPRRRKK